MFKKILVCLDGTDLSEQILPYVKAQAQKFEGRLTLFQVVHDPVIAGLNIPGSPSVPMGTENMVKQAAADEQKAIDYLKEKAAELKAEGVSVNTAVVIGNPGPYIVSYAEEKKFDMIAIASHGRGGLGRAVFGSVADHVLRKTHIPALVITPQQK